MAAEYLATQPQRPRTVFSIHNLAYLGLSGVEDFQRLGLPWRWWSPHGVEFTAGRRSPAA